VVFSVRSFLLWGHSQGYSHMALRKFGMFTVQWRSWRLRPSTSHSDVITQRRLWSWRSHRQRQLLTSSQSSITVMNVSVMHDMLKCVHAWMLASVYVLLSSFASYAYVLAYYNYCYESRLFNIVLRRMICICTDCSTCDLRFSEFV
jgi:hypothetical protein